MKLTNNIGWCDETANVVIGCDKVSRGCKNCYAETGTVARILRHGGFETWGPTGIRKENKTFIETLQRLGKKVICDRCNETFQRRERLEGLPCNFQLGSSQCDGKLRKIRLFADSNSDWLDPKWSHGQLWTLLRGINEHPGIIFQLLTKRPELFRERLESVYKVQSKMPASELFAGTLGMISYWLDDHPPRNVWAGFSAEGQKELETRAMKMFRAQVEFISAEPLLEQLDLSEAEAFCDWIIVGGESGPNRRDCGVDAIIQAVEQAAFLGIPVYCKQDCHSSSSQQGRIPLHIWQRKEFPLCN